MEIQPFVAKQYAFLEKQGLAPKEIEKSIHERFASKEKGAGVACLVTPPKPVTIQADTLADCHPGLKELSRLGHGAFGEVVAVGLDPNATDADRRRVILGGGLYSPLDPGRTYALKQLLLDDWVAADGTVSFSAAVSDWGIQSEMCVAREAGKGAVGPEVFGTWFCSVASGANFGGRDFGFILMDRVRTTFGDAIDEARSHDLVVTADAQRAVMGIHERFYQLGYFHDDAHLYNHAIDLQGRIRLLDFGFVRPWLIGWKERAVRLVARELSDEIEWTPYYRLGRHGKDNVAEEVIELIDRGSIPFRKVYKWGTMAPFTEKSVYSFPPNPDADEAFSDSGNHREKVEDTDGDIQPANLLQA
uniref:Protein kinase domain-containing protein n=1 Tax=Chromera velia CCMP2878 TaxID=1169474 RepID=A0A0G4I6H0_9ALVE|eukprot:Cvel_11414.t1-p1 / transcript=Cvel_11414.t1 / gene=Cvel_11414 / organism=Chromera_velia_CCMP2878 / gene_product=hypothetical protein / transcript_product=hypothetical protein / location=Cvel_scaffold717:27709-29198(-) / protein_length=359 / sequence_SO=supercontig / SO=protein_coding / is_pseudo=false